MQIENFVFSPFSVNTFVIWEEESLECAIVDPGCSNDGEKLELESFIIAKNLEVKYLLNTHCHIDHIFGNDFVKNNFHPKFFAPEKDVFLLKMAGEQGNVFGIKNLTSPEPDEFLSETLKLNLGKIEMQFIFTPGHTPGEFCIYIASEKICFTGDALFKDSIGRTDLWGGNFDTLIGSIRNKLFLLPDEVKIFPGHGEPSTIGDEKKYNPFLN
ncbi:MAG: MBL fold metallo-hydrolase [Bacteroidetes bacterium]|nr:MBL fold metallo-hydrolase [Bacteroidota bacterium]MBU2505928.1 MBL fold metallo-hydrolase [Bacteroidota bacterium]